GRRLDRLRQEEKNLHSADGGRQDVPLPVRLRRGLQRTASGAEHPAAGGRLHLGPLGMETNPQISTRRTHMHPRIFSVTALFLLLTGGAAQAQLSSSAYRVLGQKDFNQNSLNMVQGGELYAPAGIALDARGGQVHVYISDTHNSRVLAWADASSYAIGDPPALTLGQSTPQGTVLMGIGSKGFNAPAEMAVEPATGNLFVAD